MPSSRSTNNPSSSSSRPSASSTRPTRAPPLSSSSASTATTSSRYSQQAPPLRQPTNTLLTTVQQHASIPPSQFPPTPASVYGGSGSSHTHLAGSIDQVFAQSQQQSQFTSPAVPPQQVIQQHNVPQVPPTSFHHPTHTDRMEYAERERIAQAGRVLGSREMLMRYAVLNNEVSQQNPFLTPSTLALIPIRLFPCLSPSPHNDTMQNSRREDRTRLMTHGQRSQYRKRVSDSRNSSSG